MDTTIETYPDDILLRLTSSQRALMAAEAYGISPRSVDRAIYVLKHGNDDLIQRVREGDYSLSAAFKCVQNMS